jgi:RimJ/RimL family protein N-acetyltransferase
MSRIVFKGQTPDGISYLIRYPKRTDVSELHRYINELSKERTFISFQGEEISFQDEKKYVNSQLKKIKNKQSVQLIVEVEGNIIGVSGVDSLPRLSSHVGTFGISLAKDFRGCGIGRKLIESVLEETKKNLKHIKIIHLECFANNETACNLYKSVGFKEYGKLPGGIAYKDGFVDEVLMYKQI